MITQPYRDHCGPDPTNDEYLAETQRDVTSLAKSVQHWAEVFPNHRSELYRIAHELLGAGVRLQSIVDQLNPEPKEPRR